MKTKGCFCNPHCIDGSCPGAQYDYFGREYGFDLASDAGLDPISCKDCSWNKGTCEECLFFGDEYCPEQMTKAKIKAESVRSRDK